MARLVIAATIPRAPSEWRAPGHERRRSALSEGSLRDGRRVNAFGGWYKPSQLPRPPLQPVGRPRRHADRLGDRLRAHALRQERRGLPQHAAFAAVPMPVREAVGQADVTTKPARGKCTQTSPTAGSLRRMTISWTPEVTSSPTTGSRPVSSGVTVTV
jgi:hypothetical protein